jgi:hypothetical protein
MNQHEIEYWERYYAAHKQPFSPSLFSRHVMDNYMKRGEACIELGCGNGRDAVFFGDNGIIITAYDQCAGEISYLNRTHAKPGLRFLCGDFTNLDVSCQYQHVYSRFTLHSITQEQQDSLLAWLAPSIAAGGYFHVEFRGLGNDLHGLGEPVDGQAGAYIYEDHYRRFICREALASELERLGLEVLHSVEDKGFSPFNGTDEVFARITARKG